MKKKRPATVKIEALPNNSYRVLDICPRSGNTNRPTPSIVPTYSLGVAIVLRSWDDSMRRGDGHEGGKVFHMRATSPDGRPIGLIHEVASSFCMLLRGIVQLLYNR